MLHHDDPRIIAATSEWKEHEKDMPHWSDGMSVAEIKHFVEHHNHKVDDIVKAKLKMKKNPKSVSK